MSIENVREPVAEVPVEVTEEAAEVIEEAAEVVEEAAAGLLATASYRTTYEKRTPVYKAPNFNQPDGSLGPGTLVTIYCQTPGPSVSGPYGTSTIWDRIGTNRYVPDCYVNTGSDGYVAKRC
ncbi:hypothetical protein GCM10027168_03550 [Streptomyces capparidis]